MMPYDSMDLFYATVIDVDLYGLGIIMPNVYLIMWEIIFAFIDLDQYNDDWLNFVFNWHI